MSSPSLVVLEYCLVVSPLNSPTSVIRVWFDLVGEWDPGVWAKDMRWELKLEGKIVGFMCEWIVPCRL